jgi:hypothetical protein
MFKRPVREIERRSRNAKWQKFIDYLAISAELSNAGIFLEVVGRWLPPVARFVAVTPLAYLFLIGDPLIYFFRSLIRLSRLLGKNVFNVEFQEEKNGPPHKLQTLIDVLSLACFSAAVLLFCGVLVPPPVGITLAWTMGLCGLGFVSFTDYIWPEKLAHKKYQALLQDEAATPEMKEEAHKEYLQCKKASRMYLGLIANLAVLLICGSAVAFAPPLLGLCLYALSNTASLILGAIACGRFYNWYKSRNQETEVSPTASAKPPVEIEMTVLGASALQQKRTLPSPTASSLPAPRSVVPASQTNEALLSTSVEENKDDFSPASPPSSPSSPSKDGFFSPSRRIRPTCSLEMEPTAANEFCKSVMVV